MRTLTPHARRSRVRRENRTLGQAMVEFALLLPVFILLVMGVIDLARAFLSLQTVTNASREGARVAILPASTNAQVTGAVNNYVNAAGLVGCNTAGANWGGGAATGAATTVTVTCPFTVLVGTVVPGWAGVINLSQTTTMRHE